MVKNPNSSVNPVTSPQKKKKKSLEMQKSRRQIFHRGLRRHHTNTFFESLVLMDERGVSSSFHVQADAMDSARRRQTRLPLAREQLPNCVITCVTDQKSAASLEKHTAAN